MKKLFETERWVAYQYHGIIDIKDKRCSGYVSPERRREELVARIEELSRGPQNRQVQAQLAEARTMLAVLDDDATPVPQETGDAVFAHMLQLPEDD
jgi:hypothetical protein